MVEKQSLTQMKGEVEFRSLLYQQQVCGDSLIEGEFNRREMLPIIRSRIDKSRQDFSRLASSGFLKSPYLEIGAERCQRSLLLTNEFGLDGFAADLSFESLKCAEFLSKSFSYTKMPQRLCCDAYRLPLANNSVSFAFCYQTLHHFPDPTPVLRELHRVLKPDGVIYVDEEPVKRAWRLSLIKRKPMRHMLRSNRYLRFIANYILDFVSESSCNEVEYGICENDSISLSKWEEAFNMVGRQVEVQLKMLPAPRALREIRHDSSKPTIRSRLTNGLGGSVSAVIFAQKPVDSSRPDPTHALICPACSAPMHVETHSNSSDCMCSACSARYPMLDGILVALRDPALRELYPSLCQNLANTVPARAV